MSVIVNVDGVCIEFAVNAQEVRRLAGMTLEETYTVASAAWIAALLTANMGFKRRTAAWKSSRWGFS